MRFGKFLAKRGLSADPARRKGKNDEVAFDAAGRVAGDRLAKTDQRQWRDRKLTAR